MAGDETEAATQLDIAFKLRPDWPEAHAMLGESLARKGRMVEASSHLLKAIQLQPANPNMQYQLATILDLQRRTAEAIEHYTEALRLKPDLAGALNNLAWIRASHPDAQFRNGAEAVQLAKEACEITSYQIPGLIGTLAASYAEAGEYEMAAETARKAASLALMLGQTNLFDRNQELLKQFNSHQPWHESK
jgi:Flp pilus assembly protein TadD